MVVEAGTTRIGVTHENWIPEGGPKSHPSERGPSQGDSEAAGRGADVLAEDRQASGCKRAPDYVPAGMPVIRPSEAADWSGEESEAKGGSENSQAEVWQAIAHSGPNA